MTSLSILIPTYNGICVKLVNDLHYQAEGLGVDYEIVVADDGSTNKNTIVTNRSINQLSHCRYIEQPQNVGRAIIRNFLVQQAQYAWLLFIDSDMVVSRSDFLRRYLETEGTSVVYGGVTIGDPIPGNLRSMYENAVKHEHTVEKRQRSPYHDFHTANFMIQRDIIMRHPFDVRFHHYGYEDVLLGKQLEQHGITIQHIDNPLSFEVFETNADFICKTEEGLRTLYLFRNELQGYSRLLTSLSTPLFILATPLIRLWHIFFGNLERRNLTGSNPSLFLFKIYKLGYYLHLQNVHTT